MELVLSHALVQVVANVLGKAKQYERSVDVYSYGIML
jgi:hypothetical protein